MHTRCTVLCIMLPRRAAAEWPRPQCPRKPGPCTVSSRTIYQIATMMIAVSQTSRRSRHVVWCMQSCIGAAAGLTCALSLTHACPCPCQEDKQRKLTAAAAELLHLIPDLDVQLSKAFVLHCTTLLYSGTSTKHPRNVPLGLLSLDCAAASAGVQPQARFHPGQAAFDGRRG